MAHKQDKQSDSTATRIAADPSQLISTGATEIPLDEALSSDDSAMPDKSSIAAAMQALADTPAPKSMRDVEEADAIPPWATIPPNFNPPKGVQVIFMLFKAEWTANPRKGNRQAIAWPVTVMEEKNALSRARGDVLRSIDELSKAMVKYIDGVPVDWTGANREGNIDQWWNEVGPKCRNILHRIYTQTHNLSDDEHADFFENCIAVRTVG
jgi:hypothetical protein